VIKSIIVAKAENHVIGLNNQLPWHLPKDLQHFKHTTMGHYVILGRSTFVSMKNPLSGRKLIVLTRNLHYHAAGCTIAHDINTAFSVAEQAGAAEVLIAGGAAVYRATLPLADKIYLTEIKTELKGDAFFPMINANEWQEVSRIHHPADEKHLYAYDFVELNRKSMHKAR
jgi:dihydrofolate reductase